MNYSQASDTSWISRIIGTADSSERIRAIIARYAHFAYSRLTEPNRFSLEEIRTIGKILHSIPDPTQVLAAPYLFGDLFLEEHPRLQSTYNHAGFPMQCRLLDVAWEYAEAKELLALVAIDWRTGTHLLLAVSSDRSSLAVKATGFLQDPLTALTIDRNTEKDLHELVIQAGNILQDRSAGGQAGVYAAACSDEFFVENLFSFPLDCRFSVRFGTDSDEFGHPVPEFIF